MGDGDLFLDRLPALRFLRSAEREVFQFRELLLSGQRLDVPHRPRPIVVLAPQPVRYAIEDDGDFSKREPPEMRRVLFGFHP